MPELLFATTPVTRLGPSMNASAVGGQQQQPLQSANSINKNCLYNNKFSFKNAQTEQLKKPTVPKRKPRINNKKNAKSSTPFMSMISTPNVQNSFMMMTMDITKTEPNTGLSSAQNAVNNSNNSNNNNAVNSITSSSNNNSNNNSQLCAGCGKHIQDRYLLRALDMLWHEDCLKCGCCDCRLGEVGSTLYTKGNLMLCKRDYLRLFGNTGYCAACSKVIPAFEMVMRARTNVYHLECFACQQCNHRFCVGDRFYLCENKILCEYDYEERLVFASMANHPMLKRHASSIGQGSPTGAAGGLLGGGAVTAGTVAGARTVADHSNNNGVQLVSGGGSPYGAPLGGGGATAHMKNSLGATS